MSITNSLNDEQEKAVTTENQHLLVLAGAGSGKTRVLVHRMAWLIHTKQISPFSIFAVTFTNKAAHEMRSRTESLVGLQTNGMWIGTFHSLANRFLRTHWQEANLQETFQILDNEDQLRLLRRVIRELNVDEERFSPKQAQYYINQKKDQCFRPNQFDPPQDVFEQTMSRIYQSYDNACQQAGIVDFSELLLRTHELLQSHPELLEHYRQRFQHILIDEFQDTNTVQYQWIKLLCGHSTSLMIVGDDDQSIYGWRGAKFENIYRFQKDFPKAEIIRLEQNYRSTGNILKTANTLIHNNTARLGKHLWTQSTNGEPVTVYEAYSDKDEAQFIAMQILHWIQQGTRRDECAILYRSNAQSRIIEEMFIRMNIPYRVYGGLRFFERAEIKDALAYILLVLNRNDDPAFERIINTPARGIGEQTIAFIRQTAKDDHTSMYFAVHKIVDQNLLSTRLCNILQDFIFLIESTAREIQSRSLVEQTEHILYKSGLNEYYTLKEKGEKAVMRIENLKELISAAKQFDTESNSNQTLSNFLAYATLDAPEQQETNIDDYVQLMTLHSAKGLEFPIVFITGLEDGLFPHQMSSQTLSELEEERRLCYVGITRAMKKLYLTRANVRRSHGHESYQRPSRFFNELPKECLELTGVEAKISKPIYNPHKHCQHTPIKQVITYFSESTPFKIGQCVSHKKFGEGTIIDLENHNMNFHVQVRFKRAGTKWLDAKIAQLRIKS
jgi:DNA helicase-2/ATP-dependent DNA helicase PcrA